jgi:hypothetical protein
VRTAEAISAYKRQWREQNREREAIRRREWDLAHPERVREKDRQRRQSPQRKAYLSAYRKPYMERLRADPERFASYIERRSRNKHSEHERLMSDPARRALHLEKRRHREGCSARNWPIPCRTDDLLKRILRAIPRGFPEEIREDLCNDLYAAVLAQDISADGLSAVMKVYSSRARKLLRETWSQVSIFDVIPGTEQRILDTIAHDAPHF